MAKNTDQTKVTPAAVKWAIALVMAIVPAILAWSAMDHRTIDAETDIEEIKEKKLDKSIYDQHVDHQKEQFSDIKKLLEKIDNKL